MAIAQRVAEWTGLPPLEQTIPPLPLTIEREHFEGGLSTLAQPALKLAPLGHSVSTEGPAGVIADLATVVTDAAPATLALPGLPLPLPHPPVAPELTAAPAPAIRQLPVASPVAEAPPQRGPLTIAPLPSQPPRPLPLAQHAPTPPVDFAVVPPLGGSTAKSTGEVDAPLLADLPLPTTPVPTSAEQDVPAPAPSSPGVPDAAMPLPTSPAPAPTTDGPVAPRRLGLGEPIDPHAPAAPKPPASAADLPLPLLDAKGPAERSDSPREPVLDIATALPPEVIAPLLGAREPLMDAPTETTPTSASSGDTPPGPRLPNVSRPAPLPPSAPPAQARRGTTAPTPRGPATAGVQRAPEAGATTRSKPSVPWAGAAAGPSSTGPRGRGVPSPTMPLLSNRPLAPVTGGAAELVPFAVKSVVEQAVGTHLPDVAVHRGGESTEAARSIQAKAFTDNGEVHLPGHHGPLDAGPARALLAHELVHVAQQQRLGDTRPPEHSPAGQQLEHQAHAVEQAVARAEGPLPLHRGGAAGSGARPSQHGTADPAAAAIAAGIAHRAPDGSILFETPPAGAPEPPAPVTAPMAASSSPQRAVVGQGNDGPERGGDGGSSAAIDKEALFADFRRRLKAELRLERQRHGNSLDPRR